MAKHYIAYIWPKRDDRYQLVVVGPIEQGDHDCIHFSLDGPVDLLRAENVVSARIWFRRQGIDWIHPREPEWIVDGDRLRAESDKLGDLQWLHGRFLVLPEPAGDKVRFWLTPKSKESYMMRRIAPPEIHGALRHFNLDNADARATAFILMRFSITAAHTKILHTIRETAAHIGFRALRADDRVYHDDLFYNVLTYIYGCDVGIAVFEGLETDEFNPNVALEVGYMLALYKPVCLLKDRTLKTLQTDLIGKLYIDFDPQDPGNTIPAQLEKWLKDKELI